MSKTAFGAAESPIRSESICESETDSPAALMSIKLGALSPTWGAPEGLGTFLAWKKPQTDMATKGAQMTTRADPKSLPLYLRGWANARHRAKHRTSSPIAGISRLIQGKMW